MRLLLLRHGQTPSNVQGQLDTAMPGAGLTPLGFRQAEAVPLAFAAHPIDLIAVSPLLRTTLTAAPLAGTRGIEPEIFPGLREISAGDLEMRADPRSGRTYLDTAFAWASGDLSRRMPGGESAREFFARYDGAVAEIAERGSETVVVVSHGAAIRVWAQSRVRGVEPAIAADQRFANTAFVEITGDPDGGWDLVRWHGDPAGGSALTADDAPDPTGAADPE